VELQSEKLCSHLPDEDSELLEKVIGEPFSIESAFEGLRQEVQDLRSDQRRKLPKRESGNFRVPRCNVKLPKLELSSFGGDRTKRIEFWDSFDSSVHTKFDQR